MKQIRTYTYTQKQKKWITLLYIILSLLIITLLLVVYIFIYHVSRQLISMPLYIFLFFLFIATLSIGIYTTIRFLISATREIVTSKNELALKDVIIQHSDEIIILLDMFGRILSINPALTSILKFNKEDVIQHPFRVILFEKSFEDSIRLRDLLLSRFKDVFKGYEAEIVLPCKVQHHSEIKSIAFKLIPVFQDNNLQFILAIGRVIQSDFLTSHYLKTEYAEFIIDNNIRMVNLLSYRLTRNLEPYLEKREIIRIQLGLQEAIINAIEHGNLEIDFETKSRLKKMEGNYWDHVLDICNKDHLEKRKIKVQYHLFIDCVKYIITDEGKGFDWKQYVRAAPDGNLIHTYHGVGLTMLQDIFEVSFNEKGNEITLVKRFS
ncbi:MAG TPA: ATP-binding protein [Spirochaetota bacterium]|nr:ATP-binding protein [Spirochaetota bacterium]